MASPQPSPRGQRECHILALPSHLQTSIFRLADAADLPALRLTCRAFLAPATEAATRLTLRRGGGGGGGASDAGGGGSPRLRPASFPFLQELDASEAAGEWCESWLLEAAAAAPALETLKLGRLPALSTRGAAALAELPCLARLELGGCALADASLAGALGRLGGLREADLSMCAHLGDATLAALAAGCPRLAKLDLTGCERVSEAGLRALGALPLRALILSACCQLTDGCLRAIAQGLPRLECLGLYEAGEEVTDEGLAALAPLGASLTALDLGYSCWSHTAAGLAALLQRTPRLRMLNIGGCEGTCDAAVAAVARHCPELRELDVSESQRMTADGVRQLGRLAQLRDLLLGWNIRLRDDALDALPASISRLDLSFCGEITDRGLAHVARRLPALASLTLRKCGRLSDGGLAALSGASALTHLDLSYTSISAAGLGALRPLRALASLALIDCLRAASPPAMMLLAQLPSLEALDLSDGKRLDDGSMQALSHAPRLRSLVLNACCKVSDRGLLALTRCASLRQLSVDRCPQLSGAALAALQRRLVLLRLARPAGAAARPAAAVAEY